MGKKDEFMQAIASVSSYSHALQSLLSAASNDHFTSTLGGAIKDNEIEGSSAGGAYWWMYGHYDSATAAVNAAACLAESLSGLAEGLYSTAQVLVPDSH